MMSIPYPNRHLFLGVFRCFRSTKSDVALQCPSCGRHITQGVRFKRCTVGQIRHRYRSPQWTDIISAWNARSTFKNAFLHGERWPHLQVRTKFVFLEEIPSYQCRILIDQWKSSYQ